MGITWGTVLAGVGIIGVIVTLVIQLILLPVFYRQRHKILEDLGK